MALKKICEYNGCRCLIDYSEKYCEKHKVVAEQDNKKRYKEYKTRRMQDKKEKKLNDFYNSKKWVRLRELVKVKQIGMDILEYYKAGKVVAAQTYHHIVELREDYNKGLDINNIIGLSESNHKHIHYLYNKSEQSKKDTQRTLLGLVEKFYKEFG